MLRPAVLTAFALLIAGALFFSPDISYAKKRSKAKTTSDPAARLFAKAERDLETVKNDRKKRKFRDRWEKAITGFDGVIAKYPASPYAEKALFARAGAIESMYRVSRVEHDLDSAIESYEQYYHKYPGGADIGKARERLKALTGSDPGKPVEVRPEPPAQSAPPPRVEARTASPAERPAASGAVRETEPSASPPDAAGVTPGAIKSVRHWSSESYTRVVVDGASTYTAGSLKDPERLFFDIKDARLEPPLKDGPITVGDGLLKSIRASQYAPDVVRVVLDLDAKGEYRTMMLTDPPRLVIDVLGRKQEMKAESGEIIEVRPVPAEKPAPEPAGRAEKAQKKGRGRLITIRPPKEPDPPPVPLVVSDERPARAEPPKEASAPDPVQGAADAAPSGETRKEARAARTVNFCKSCIVIDPGHGGKDSGAVGQNGLYEKDVVLDIGLKLREILLKELGCKAVMTRDKDVFIDLSARPGIAIKNNADLFISIHANASFDSSAKGVETYLLNTTKDRNIMELAARENMMTIEKMNDSPTMAILKDLILDSKREESLKLAHVVQESIVGSVQELIGHVNDKGVKQGPFLVLYGAEMPSILTEVGFISNPDEEKLLADPEYRRELARAIFQGIKQYISTSKTITIQAER